MVTEQQRLNLIQTLFSFYGLKEWTAPGKSNPEIEDFFEELGFNYTDDTAWCSAFANFVAKKVGLEYTGKLNARSWLTVGYQVTEPAVGDVVVFWRQSKSSWKGHVAFYINEDDKYIYVLGGNQSNMVNVAAYPKYRLLQYRRLT